MKKLVFSHQKICAARKGKTPVSRPKATPKEAKQVSDSMQRSQMHLRSTKVDYTPSSDEEFEEFDSDGDFVDGG
jgi:hypothetical protein